MNLNELRDEAYSIAKANGWHEQEHSDEHFIMLIITEIAEAVQTCRYSQVQGMARKQPAVIRRNPDKEIQGRF